MRLPSACAFALPLLATAQMEVPVVDRMKNWYNQAQDYIKTAAAVPADAGASKVAEHAVQPLGMDNWRSVLQHSGAVKPYNPPEAWFVYITGGNDTCNGLCGKVDRAWNESVAMFSSDVSAPSLGSINCDKEPVLCGMWAVEVPAVWVFLVPQPLPDQSSANTPLHIFQLNHTTATNTDITMIHTRKLYLNTPQYTGVLHPFDGLLAKTYLNVPMAYALWALAKVPSWAIMVAISFFSRSFISRRMPRGPPAHGNQGAAAPAS